MASSKCEPERRNLITLFGLSSLCEITFPLDFTD